MPDAPAPNPIDWQTEFERLTPRLICWAAFRLHGRPMADAEDLAQDVLCRAWLHRSRFTGGDCRAWVFQIARNVLLEHARRQRKVRRVQIAEGDTARADQLAQVSDHLTTMTRRIARSDDVQKLLQEAAALDDTDRRLLLLCGMEELPTREAAVVVGLGEEATAKRWYRLRQKLRETCDWFAA
ncbi:MAG: sigma-70 family RNA polymerase sigma factor [Planctomycetes bacterium]|nr:sigma-70 family RNA polymerase sigma factor [Planctomycetota bacterium]